MLCIINCVLRTLVSYQRSNWKLSYFGEIYIISHASCIHFLYYVRRHVQIGSSPEPKKKIPPNPTATLDLMEQEAMIPAFCVCVWISVISIAVDENKTIAKNQFHPMCGKLGYGCFINSLEMQTESCFLFSSPAQPFYWSNGKRPELRFRATVRTRAALIWMSCWIQCGLKMMHDGNSSQTGAVH